MLHSLEGDRVLAVVRLAVPDQEAGLLAGLQLELGLLAGHTAMVPAETRGTREEDHHLSVTDRGYNTIPHNLLTASSRVYCLNFTK